MKELDVCDACGKRLYGGGYNINIEYNESVANYSGCSVKCCTKIFRQLADEWDGKDGEESKVRVHIDNIPVGVRIEPSWEVIEDEPEECEGYKQYKCRNQSLIDAISSLLCETNEDAHRAMIFAIAALIIAVLALFV